LREKKKKNAPNPKQVQFLELQDLFIARAHVQLCELVLLLCCFWRSFQFSTVLASAAEEQACTDQSPSSLRVMSQLEPEPEHDHLAEQEQASCSGDFDHSAAAFGARQRAGKRARECITAEEPNPSKNNLLNSECVEETTGSDAGIILSIRAKVSAAQESM
jgi:hypothetical protein